MSFEYDLGGNKVQPKVFILEYSLIKKIHFTFFQNIFGQYCWFKFIDFYHSNINIDTGLVHNNISYYYVVFTFEQRQKICYDQITRNIIYPRYLIYKDIYNNSDLVIIPRLVDHLNSTKKKCKKLQILENLEKENKITFEHRFKASLGWA